MNQANYVRDRDALDLGPNAALIGQPGSRNELATPCLVLDRAALHRNIATAAHWTQSKGIDFRPHAKSHKCSKIAALQIAAGASGVCVATVGEAEALARGGIGNILITSSVTQPAKFQRIADLVAQGTTLAVVADEPSIVEALAWVCARNGVVLDVLVDVDLGRKRNGVTTVEQALAVAAAIGWQPSLRFAGLQTYASHISHVEDYGARLEASRQSAQQIERIVAGLLAAGHGIGVVTGGSTGTVFIDPDLGCYRELQCGSYVFNDVEYRGVDLDGKHSAAFDAGLFVRVSVIGRNVAGRVTCDGGNKHFSAKGTLPAFLAPPVAGATYTPDSDEHGIIHLPVGAAQPALGSAFELIVPHCDPTVNLYSHYHLVDGDTLVDIWPIEARGAF